MATTGHRTYIARSGTGPTNTTPVALAAGVAKTVVAVLGSATDTIHLERFRLSFSGIDPVAAPAVAELGIITALGTATAFTPVQNSGPTLASSVTAGYNHTAEPTYNRIIDSFYVPVFGGHFSDWIPLGFEAQCAPSQGFGLRINSPSVVNCLAQIMYGE